MVCLHRGAGARARRGLGKETHRVLQHLLYTLGLPVLGSSTQCSIPRLEFQREVVQLVHCPLIRLFQAALDELIDGLAFGQIVRLRLILLNVAQDLS